MSKTRAHSSFLTWLPYITYLDSFPFANWPIIITTNLSSPKCRYPIALSTQLYLLSSLLVIAYSFRAPLPFPPHSESLSRLNHKRCLLVFLHLTKIAHKMPLRRGRHSDTKSLNPLGQCIFFLLIHRHLLHPTCSSSPISTLAKTDKVFLKSHADST